MSADNQVKTDLHGDSAADAARVLGGTVAASEDLGERVLLEEGAPDGARGEALSTRSDADSAASAGNPALLDAAEALRWEHLLGMTYEADLSEALAACLVHPELARLTQPLLLGSAGDRGRALATVAERTPITLLATPRGQLGLDLWIAIEDKGELVAVAAAELKGRNPRTGKHSPAQVSRIHHFRTPHTNRSRRLLDAIDQACDLGALVLDVHDKAKCVCGGDWLHQRVRGRPAGRCIAVMAQTSALGFLEAAQTARPVTGDITRRITRVAEDVSGCSSPVNRT